MGIFRKKHSTATQTLWRVVETDETDAVDAVISSGADINAGNSFGTTALMRAAAKGRTQMVRVLLKNGADPNRLRNDKFTALLLAAFFGHDQIVKILVEHGADINATTRFGTSAQTWANARIYTDVVEYLEKKEKSLTTDRLEPNWEFTSAKIDTVPRISDPAPNSPSFVTIDSPEIAQTPSSTSSSGAWIWSVSLSGIAAILLIVGVIGTVSLVRRPYEIRGPTPAPDRTPVQSKVENPAPMITKPSTSEVEVSQVMPESAAHHEDRKQKTPNQLIVGPNRELKKIVNRWQAPEDNNVIHPNPIPIKSIESVQSTELPAAPPIHKPRVITSRGSTVNVPLSPQLINGSKSEAKSGKVIHWP